MTLQGLRKPALVVATLIAGLMITLGFFRGAPALSVAGVVVLMAGHWILDGMPVGATSLIPLVAFPLLSIVPIKEVAKAYTSSTVFLLVGGFFLAKGLERWSVPEFVAAWVERVSRGSPRLLLGGMMAATCVMSMWLSNTATTLIMATVALSTLTQAKACTNNTAEGIRAFEVALFLGIAYAANIGGLATPVGTAPNAILLAQLEKLMPQTSITFVQWMAATLPLVLVLMPAVYLFLVFVSCRFPKTLSLGAQSGKEVPPLSRGGKLALAIFFLTATLWVTRSNINVGAFIIPGWSDALGLKSFVDDGSVAIFGTLLMFICPAFSVPQKEVADSTQPFQTRILDWKNANEIPWYLILLFGGGLALADGFKKSGLSIWLGEQLVWLEGAPLILVVLVLCAGMSLLTEVTSNTATTTLVLPVLFSAAAAVGLAPLWLMFPATLCASAAFILPISTPPNAIAAGAGDIAPSQMAKVGAPLNAIAVLLISLVVVFYCSRILPF